MLTALKRLRRSRGMTQRQLAEKAGWADRLATISDLEKGKTNPTLSTMQQVAAALGVEVRDLFEPSDPAEAEISRMIDDVATLEPEDRDILFRLAVRLGKARDELPE